MENDVTGLMRCSLIPEIRQRLLDGPP
ncbi:uncharacterized protein METZ01_LOCUS133020 [marine metagenome]|uniref:Uncharacterized protein n=1 Tax=marine metagenome TaxID=408172 RepID=A0A381YSZ8_9ZZZZ